MQHFWSRFRRFLYRYTVIALIGLLCIGTGVGIANLFDLTDTLVENQAEAAAELYADVLQRSQMVYTMEVAGRLSGIEGVEVSHNYAEIDGAIPNPSTYLMKTGWSLSNDGTGINVGVFSQYPFQGGNEEIKVRNLDGFQSEAIEILERKNGLNYSSVEMLDGVRYLRCAKALVMDASCLACHNTHPDSPKTDWKLGDIGGALEVSLPLNNYTASAHAQLGKTFVVFGSLLLIASVGVVLVVKRLQAHSHELELKVGERTLQLQNLNEELSVERRKSDRLLFNTLPQAIANRIKQGEHNIADWFSEVTILFADIVGFTSLSERVPPEQMIQLLNEIFSALDRLSEQHGLEKIRTIGDNYMVAAGVPVQRADHAKAIAEMALGIQREIHQFNQRHDVDIKMRVGINTGSVIGGVVGTQKMLYDIWGDAVNTASRMESHGIPGKIQVTRKTAIILKDQYVFKRRGTLDIKGKGAMETYLLIERKS